MSYRLRMQDLPNYLLNNGKNEVNVLYLYQYPDHFIRICGVFDNIDLVCKYQHDHYEETRYYAGTTAKLTSCEGFKIQYNSDILNTINLSEDNLLRLLQEYVTMKAHIDNSAEQRQSLRKEIDAVKEQMKEQAKELNELRRYKYENELKKQSFITVGADTTSKDNASASSDTSGYINFGITT